jgi:hypothetical protein
MLNALSLRLGCFRSLAQGATRLTRGRIGSALFNPFVICGSPPVVSAGLKPRSTDYAAPHADSQSDSALGADAPRASSRQGCVCACTHYLVFKEPALRVPRYGRQAGGPPRRHSRRCTFRPLRRPCLGEPSEVTSRSRLCQP